MVGGIGSRAINKITDLRVRSFVNKAKNGQLRGAKLTDGGGMYLMITLAGTPVWRLKYRYDGKERVFAIGIYPTITLDAARAERDRVKALLRAGRDPVQTRSLERVRAVSASGDTFNSVAEDWLAKQRREWSDIHYRKSKRALERDVLPRIGNLPIRDIAPGMIGTVIEEILKRKVRETAAKVLQHVTAVFRYAQAHGLRADNPADAVSELMPPRPMVRPMSALLTWAGLGDILRRAESASLSPSVRLAHRLCAFSVARISNVVEAEWAEFDLDSDVAIWTIPRSKMKSQDRHHDHKIVLAPAIASELRDWRSVVGTVGPVFRSPQGRKHISRESIEKAYRVTLGLAGKHSPHGWRSAFSTLARDHGFERDVVELTLDHIYDTDVVRAYDRGERLQQRIQLMYWWGEQLIRAQNSGALAASDSARAVYRVRLTRALRRRSDVAQAAA